MLRHYPFRPSRYLALSLFAIHVIALVALWPLSLPFWSKVLLSLLLLGSLLHHLWRDAWLRSGDSCIGLVLSEQGALLLKRDGSRVSCTILPGGLITPYLTVLCLAPRKAGSVVILPDSLNADAFRQLRVRLKWRAQDWR